MKGRQKGPNSDQKRSSDPIYIFTYMIHRDETIEDI